MRVRCYKDVATRTFFFLTAYTALPECPRRPRVYLLPPPWHDAISSVWLNINSLATDYA